MQVGRKERLADEGSGDMSTTGGDRAARGDQMPGERWREPPPAGQHPFSDIIWFS